MENQVISARQFTIIVTFYAIGTSFLILPGTIVGEVKQDAWISSILAVLISLVIVKIFIATGNISSNMSLVEINRKVLGVWIGNVVSLTFVFFTFMTAGELLYFVSDFMNTSIMHDMSAYSFSILFGLIIILGCSLGLETFSRSAEILFPLFFIFFILFIFLISPQIRIEDIQPVLEDGPKPILYGVLLFISFFSLPMVSLLMIFPVSLRDKKEARKGFYIGTIVGGVVLIIIVTLCILVLNPNNTAHSRYPGYDLAKLITIGNFIERIEVIMAFMWIVTIFFKTLIYYYASVIGLGQILKIKNYRVLNLPLGFTLILLSYFIHPDILHSDIYNKGPWIPFVATYGLLLPLLLLVVAKIRKIN
ncbi:spore gernimation protein [Lysinibacillus mangiferihumi]|uniref:Spore gernimation protein n=1 Tax=Lysinibacillus mangiferihumi TaxID=1130819 RepID=A0A4V5TPK5_9BACI|nr:endospore germination permease [Lysinibacillus mangiferihumi]TKI71973.1 spore gernimation protein [Lysinibacillus mangiferihumi]